MTVVDIRNIVTDSNVELIEISDSLIYYAEEKNEEGLNSLFLLEYNRETRRERVVANYILEDPTFVQHYFSFPDDIIIVMENAESTVWICRVDKKTGKEKNMDQVHFVGSFCGCTAVDANHVLFHTRENARQRHLFEEYRRLTGVSRVAYLYDLETRQYYYVRDTRVCEISAENILPFDVSGQTQLLLLQPYGTEEDKAHSFRNMRWLGDHICDRVWICPLLDFLVEIKNGDARLSMESLLSVGTNGMVRYSGMDRKKLYFRVKNFSTQDMRVCSVDKMTLKKRVEAPLNLAVEELPARFYYDIPNAAVYRIAEQDDGIRIDGVLNSTVSAFCASDLGDLVACIENRFLILRYVMQDQTDSFEFHTIYDNETQAQQSYEGRCAIQGNTVVLY